MPDLVQQPDVGKGPWSVEHDEADGFYYLRANGVRDPAKQPYPLGKTAYRRARQLNDAEPPQTPGIVVGLDLSGTKAEVAARYPDKPKAKSDTRNARGKRVKRELAKEKAATAPSRKAPKVKPEPAPKPELKDTATHSTVVFQGTREEWLNAFVAAARPVFKSRGHELPDKVRVSIGFVGLRGGGKALGACWHEAASTDGTREIFVVPTVDDSSRIADILTHELCHTLFGPDEKHGRNFKKAATDLGLEGKATATVAGAAWHEWADPILADLGPIPHAALNPLLSGIKKQTTRLIKCECDDCGFTFRATAKWVSGKALQCPDVDCLGTVTIAG